MNNVAEFINKMNGDREHEWQHVADCQALHDRGEFADYVFRVGSSWAWMTVDRTGSIISGRVDWNQTPEQAAKDAIAAATSKATPTDERR
jgi:hypothetical protein